MSSSSILLLQFYALTFKAFDHILRPYIELDLCRPDLVLLLPVRGCSLRSQASFPSCLPELMLTGNAKD